MSHRADVEVSPAARRLLLVAAVLVFLAGLQLFVFPGRTDEWFAWTIDPPMTAVFLGAAYWSSAVLEVAGARSATWQRARLTVWPVLVFTALTLLVTMVHLEKFHLGDEHPASARVVAWGWLVIYAVVPAALVAVLVRQARPGREAAATSRHRRLPDGLRALLVVLAVALLASGLMLLVAPGEVADWWPWPLTPLTARAIGAWLVGLAWAAGHAAVADDADDVQPLGLTGLTFFVLQGLALVREGDDLAWSEPPAATYIGLLVVIGVVSGWILALRSRDRG